MSRPAIIFWCTLAWAACLGMILLVAGTPTGVLAGPNATPPTQTPIGATVVATGGPTPTTPAINEPVKVIWVSSTPLGPARDEFPDGTTLVYVNFWYPADTDYRIEFYNDFGALQSPRIEGRYTAASGVISMPWSPASGSLPFVASPYHTRLLVKIGGQYTRYQEVTWDIGSTLRFNQSAYTGNAFANLEVIDKFANANTQGFDIITVTLKSGAEPGGIVLRLRETSSVSGRFSTGAPGFPAITFCASSDCVSDGNAGILKVNSSGDTIQATYRTVKGTQLQASATWTPSGGGGGTTPLPPTATGPPTLTPTPTPTNPMGAVRITATPAPERVGFMTGRHGGAVFLGDQTQDIYTGWRDTSTSASIFVGFVEFNAVLPANAQIVSADLALVGKTDSLLANGGQWSVELIDFSGKSISYTMTFTDVFAANTLGTLNPVLQRSDLAAGRLNRLFFNRGALEGLRDSLTSGQRAVFRITGPLSWPFTDNLFGWWTGTLGSDPANAPRLTLNYIVQAPSATPSLTPQFTASPTATSSATPTPSLTPTGTLPPTLTPSVTPTPSPTTTPSGARFVLVHGVVRDCQGQPLAGTLVSVEGSTTLGTATTRGDGFYSVGPYYPPFLAQVYLITASASGYMSVTQEIELAPQYAPFTVNFEAATCLALSPTSTATTDPPSATPPPTASATATPTASATATATTPPSHTPTQAPNATGTASATLPPSATPQPTNTATVAPTQPPTHTATLTPSATHTATVTPSATHTASVTPSATHTATATVTPSPTLTATITPSATNTATATVTMTPSPSPQPTATASVTPSPTATLGPTGVSFDAAFYVGEGALARVRVVDHQRTETLVFAQVWTEFAANPLSIPLFRSETVPGLYLPDSNSLVGFCTTCFINQGSPTFRLRVLGARTQLHVSYTDRQNVVHASQAIWFEVQPATETPTPTATATATATRTPALPTHTPLPTETPVPSPTASPSPSATPSASPTALPSATATPSRTPTPTATRDPYPHRAFLPYIIAGCSVGDAHCRVNSPKSPVPSLFTGMTSLWRALLETEW